MTLLAGAPRTITAEELRIVAEANHLFVMREQGRIVGLLCLVPMHLPQGVRLWLESFIVDPGRRRVGHGRALMAAALTRAATYGSVPVSLTSNPTRTLAHQLFEQLGFVRAETSVFRRIA
jgi:GNAT superfamily N-acetyltransferase